MVPEVKLFFSPCPEENKNSITARLTALVRVLLP